MDKHYYWAQIAILHDNGYGIIGKGRTEVSKSQNLPKLPRRVPVVDMRGIKIQTWQTVLREHSAFGIVMDVKELVEELEFLK